MVVVPPRKPEAEASRVPEPKEDVEPTEKLEEKETTDEAKDTGDDGASPCGGSRGEVLARAEEITLRDCAPLDCQGGGGGGGGGDGANGWTDAAEKCEVVDCEAGGDEVMHGSVLTDRRSPDPTEVEAGCDGGESKASAAPSSRVDLGMEDGWFQKLEAKMGAIKKQVRVRSTVRGTFLLFLFFFVHPVGCRQAIGIRCWLPDDALPNLGEVGRAHVLHSAAGGILRLAAGHNRLIPCVNQPMNVDTLPEYPHLRVVCFRIMTPTGKGGPD